MNIRRFFALLLPAVLLTSLVLTSCGESKTDTPAGVTAASTEAEVT